MIHDIINNELARKLHIQLEQLLIEGLKLKGFEFESKQELELFVKERCTCKDNIHFKERVYYVDDMPFFLHNYDMKMNPITEINNSVTITANWGSYKFL